MDKMRMESVDMTEKNIDRIADLFPNCITEALDEEHSTPSHKVYKKVVNFELLKQMLSGDVLEGDEAYEFTWVGKKAAIVEANKPIRKTLRPLKEKSVDWDNTQNMYIEGDNLDVLKTLQEEITFIEMTSLWEVRSMMSRLGLLMKKALDWRLILSALRVSIQHGLQ